MKKIIIAGAVVVLVGGGIGYYLVQKDTSYTTATAERGSITQEVPATGKVATPSTISLQFQGSGKLVALNVQVGDTVSAGKILAEQDTTVLKAQLAGAEAVYNTAVAAHSAHSIPLTKTEAVQTYNAAYQTLDATLHNDIDAFFGEPTAYGPLLLITASLDDSRELSRQRESINDDFKAWLKDLSTADQSDPKDLLAKASLETQKVSDFVTLLAYTANERNSGANSTQLADLTAARSSITGLLAIISAAQDLYSSKSISATSVAESSIDAAAASVALIEAQIAQMSLLAPVNGTITGTSGNVGETVSPAIAVVTMLPKSKLQVDANVSEDNIANVALGEPVRITLDAFNGAQWNGVVGAIDPAQTIVSGAVYYKTTIAFDSPDERIKPGMTANIWVQTGAASSTLVLPASAIRKDGTTSYVRVLQNGNVTNRDVIVGLKSINGKVEIKTGLIEGDQVLLGVQ